MSTLVAFILGLLVGWIVEWIIDWVYWRRRQAAMAHDLEQANSRMRQIQSDHQDLEKHFDMQSKEVVRLETELAGLKAEKEALLAQSKTPVNPLEATGLPVAPVETPQVGAVAPVGGERAAPVIMPFPEGQAAPFERDDLEVIVGIGPVIARKLNEAGIYTFSDLGRLTASDLREKVGDMISRLADEEDILRQARLLAEQKSQKV